MTGSSLTNASMGMPGPYAESLEFPDFFRCEMAIQKTVAPPCTANTYLSPGKVERLLDLLHRTKGLRASPSGAMGGASDHLSEAATLLTKSLWGPTQPADGRGGPDTTGQFVNAGPEVKGLGALGQI